MKRWNLTNVLVGGRRVSGEANGRDAQEAVRHLAAAEARSRQLDIAWAVAGALRDTGKRVSELGAEDRRAVARAADSMLARPDRPAANFTEWPAILR